MNRSADSPDRLVSLAKASQITQFVPQFTTSEKRKNNIMPISSGFLTSLVVLLHSGYYSIIKKNIYWLGNCSQHWAMKEYAGYYPIIVLLKHYSVLLVHATWRSNFHHLHCYHPGPSHYCLSVKTCSQPPEAAPCFCPGLPTTWFYPQESLSTQQAEWSC